MQGVPSAVIYLIVSVAAPEKYGFTKYQPERLETVAGFSSVVFESNARVPVTVTAVAFSEVAAPFVALSILLSPTEMLST